MKINKIILFITLIILSITPVYAKEVSVKYEYKKDDSIYSKEIVSKRTNISINNMEMTIVDTQKNYLNDTIKMINVTDNNQISWIKNTISNDEIIDIYYFILEDNKHNKVDINNLKIRLENNSNNYTIIVINDGKILDTSLDDAKLLNDSFIIIVDNNKTINLNISSGGSVIIDGEIIEENGSYKTTSDKLIIRSNSNYILESILINNKDVSEKINNGFLDISKLKNIDLKVNFVEMEEDEDEKQYSFSGQIFFEGKPLSNATVELHSKTLITTTDEEGKFTFENVSLGNHSITVSKNDKVLAYSEFSLKSDDKDNIEIVYNNEKVVSKDKINVKLSIDENYNLAIDSNRIRNNNTKTIMIASIVFIIMVIGGFFIAIKK